MRKKTTVYASSYGLKHQTGPGHPERPERLQVLLDMIEETAFSGLEVIEAQPATDDWIQRVHPGDYLYDIEALEPERGVVNIDADTMLGPGSVRAARQAAGAVCQAVTDIREARTDRAFCLGRPPGHHAEPGSSMGFCVFNNIAIGALHALASGAFSRVAIVDFDVHHGNGTETVARKTEGLFFASSHQWPLFPGTGGPEDQIEERILNAPLPAGTGSADFRLAWQGRILPAVEAFRPDLLMISAGFDAHRDDPLGSMALETEDFYWITAALCDLADRHCRGKVVSVLEGGYDLAALRDCARVHLTALMGG